MRVRPVSIASRYTYTSYNGAGVKHYHSIKHNAHPIIRIVMARKALALTSRIKYIMLIGISNAPHLTLF